MSETLDLNVQLGPQFTLIVDNTSSNPLETFSLLVESDPLITVGVTDSSKPMVLKIQPYQQVLSLEVGVKSSSLFANEGGTTTSSNFLPSPDEIEDSDLTYFYFGWINLNGSWRIHRQLRSSAETLSATSTNNSNFVDFASAWLDKENLNFG